MFLGRPYASILLIMLTYARASFAEVLPIWQNHLWPARKSPIRPLSSLCFLGGHDLQIYQKYSADFFCTRSNGEIVAVISGHPTSAAHYRSRGIYVRDKFRGRGIARKLFSLVREESENRGFALLWSLPRKDSWPAYSAFGFQAASPWIDDEFEFGPNCYAIIPHRQIK